MSEEKHIEAVRAEVFKEVIGRTESTTSRYRRPWEGRSRTRAAFTPPDGRAHWGEMLAELQDSLPTNPNVNFDTIVYRGDGEAPYRVKDAFADAMPVARVARKVATFYDIDNETPWPVDAIINAKYLPIQAWTGQTPPSATRMPDLSAALAARAVQEMTLLEPAQLLIKQSQNYLDSGGARIGRLLAAVARNYGVVGAGPLMEKVARTWVMPNWMQGVWLADEVVTAADTAQNWFYADGDAARALLHRDEPAGEAIPALPQPTGMLLIATEEQKPTLVAWREQGHQIDIVSCRPFTRLAKEKMNTSMWSTVSVDWSTGVMEPYGSSSALGIVARLAAILHAAPPSPEAQRNAGDGGRPAERAPVVVRYTASRPAARDRDTDARDRKLEALKWRVRGHWRRQWYPSLGAHRPVWIEEHIVERGEAGELIERPTVVKLSQRS